ncbi:ferroptosis suppressor protein 1-like isoform X2 [Tigriopus californicus]|nr:ferroptosis suppressor protein 1-like isoform X2 [Tigriopus californicus]
MGEMGGSQSLPELAQEQSIHVVVIGGGYGGTTCALALKKHGIPYTLVEPKEYFHHNVGALRAAVDKGFIPRTAIPLKDSFQDQFVQEKVTDINFEGRTLTLESGKSLEYSHLVIATGSSGPFPGRTETRTIQDLADAYETIGNEIEKAESVVLIGGGAVGVELAGEIRSKYKFKKITLIHSGEQLFNSARGAAMDDRTRDAALAMLKAMDVDVVLGERVSNLEGLTLYRNMSQTVKTDQEKVVNADLILSCTGLKADLSLKSNYPEGTLDNENRLKVNAQTMEVEGLSNVFGIGDCANVPQEKMAAHAGDQGELVVKNLIASLKGSSLSEYKPRFEGMFVTVGPGGGVALFNGWHIPSFLVGLAKSKDLFTKRYWTMFGQREPV